jgi:hypothetical protein
MLVKVPFVTVAVPVLELAVAEAVNVPDARRGEVVLRLLTCTEP